MGAPRGCRRDKGDEERRDEGKEGENRGEKGLSPRRYTRQRNAHKASNVYNTEESYPGELLRPVWRLPLNFSSFADPPFPLPDYLLVIPDTPCVQCDPFSFLGNLRYAPIFSDDPPLLVKAWNF